MSKEVFTQADIARLYEELLDVAYNAQKRGYQLEKLIYFVLENEDLDPKSGYKPIGEQIDGSFFWNGQTFLLEAKWVENPLPVSSIYSFKGKLDGKFHTTSGVFISMNGYSENVEDALRFGKSLNIILFDQNDMDLIFKGSVSFIEVLKFKLRQAGDTGSLLSPYILKDKAEEISKTPSTDILQVDEFISDAHKNKKIDDLLIFVEGKSDVPIIRNLIAPIGSSYSFSYKIEILQGAMNIRQLPSLINIYGDLKHTKAVIVILDDDQQTKNMVDVIQNIQKQLQNSSVYVRTLFLFIPELLKLKLAGIQQTETLAGEPIYEQLELFVYQMAGDYYDPETDIPTRALEGAMNKLTFNYRKGLLEGVDEYYDMPFVIADIDALIEYLDEQIAYALNAYMPLDWLKNTDFDYRTEVQEFLIDNYYDQIEKLGWDASSL